MSHDQETAALRLELKAWEKAFSAANGGRKTTREDIKANSEIAIKYKQYDRIKRPDQKKSESRSKPAPSKTEQTTKHASKTQPIASTPQKSKSLSALPFPVIQPLEEEYENEIEPTPAAIRMQLGPTPLKDGQILSLFDDLSGGTPSKPRSVLEPIQGNVATTPSKGRRRNFAIAESPAIENVREGRTPTSSGKRFMLDTCATPLKRKRDDEDNVHGTPSSSMRLLATPAFLRRSNTVSIMETLAEEGEQDGETIGLTRARGPPFKKKKGFIRSLSSIIQGMRKQEDDKLDEELDIMREMDAFDDFDEPTGPTLQHKKKAEEEKSEEKKPEPDVQVEDSQVVMPLGPDRLYDSDYDESDEEDEHGQPRKVWKKKGLKRQTKRVIMRPVTHKPKKADAPSQPEPETNNNRDDQPVAETQHQVQALDVPSDFFDESDYSDSEAKLQKVQSQATAKSAAGSTEKTEGPVKKAARMISAGAHANFRRLKIKNQNSKAKGRGRFGRK